MEILHYNCFRIELEFMNVGFCEGRKAGAPPPPPHAKQSKP